ncbi:hypothetical protein EW145_g6044 [Phellinidium pouzarii]|uniref:Uncharacterized protein n=1 Tax=Phellinidium pouzarii TaxID=167371 RepID=A0A4S4KXW7_9AGAM|nr:hypothetical protein EW145_g6044 [Phellinidium pouzarii]
MDVDQPDSAQHFSTNEPRANAQAGPSSLPDVPAIFLPPPGQLHIPSCIIPVADIFFLILFTILSVFSPGPLRRKPLFDSTQDLITRFQLLPSYDKYVRPHVHPSGNGAQHSTQTPANASVSMPGPHHTVPTPGAVDKGKGREIPTVTPHTPLGAPTPTGADGGDGDDGEEDGGKGDRKQKNSYKHLIKEIPGKHSMKKDDYLQNIMLVPPKQKIQITKFDPRTQREAFAVSLEGLKGTLSPLLTCRLQWNINALVAESAQAREDRKRRKELKKLAKAQAQAAQAGIPLPAPLATASTTSSAPTPTTAATPGFRQPQTPASMGAGTPRPQGPGPGPPVHAGQVGMPAQGLPRAGTPVPRPGSRGKKRELEEDGPNAVPSNGAVAVGFSAGGVKRAPPGNGGVKSGMPRPAKRMRTDANPHSMGLQSAPQQQPTPQGPFYVTTAIHLIHDKTSYNFTTNANRRHTDHFTYSQPL